MLDNPGSDVILRDCSLRQMLVYFLKLGTTGFGGLSAALGVFLPCYLFVILPAPHFQRIAKNPWIAAFVEGVTAAATGAIAGAAIVLGRRAIVDVPTVLIAGAMFFMLWKVQRIPEPAAIMAAGILGLVLRQS